MKIIKSCFKNYLSLLLALVIIGMGALFACKPEAAPLGSPTRGFRWVSGTGLEAWGENSSGGGVRGFIITLSGYLDKIYMENPTINGTVTLTGSVVASAGVNATAADIDYLTSPIGRAATISLATQVSGAASNSTWQEVRQADYVCDNSTNTLAKYVLAMAAMPTAGGSISYASGNFVASNNFTVSKPGITIRGQGYNTVATMNATGAVFYVTANNTCFENIRTDIGGITTRLNVDTPRYSNVWIGSTYYETITTGAITNTGTSTLTTLTFSSITGIASGSVNMTQGLYYVQVTHGLATKPLKVMMSFETIPNHTMGPLWWATANATDTEFQILTSDNAVATAVTQIGWVAYMANY